MKFREDLIRSVAKCICSFAIKIDTLDIMLMTDNLAITRNIHCYESSNRSIILFIQIYDKNQYDGTSLALNLALKLSR